jgi:hypothetical protein
MMKELLDGLLNSDFDGRVPLRIRKINVGQERLL